MLEKIKKFIIPEDLVPDAFPEIEWNAENLEKSVEKIFQYVVNEAEKSWRFYYERRKTKRLLGLIFRLAMIIAGSLAVIIPIFGEIYNTNGVPCISPSWASIALAAAAFFGAVDKLGDFSGARARYLVTQRKIFRDLDSFRIDWEKARLEREGKTLDMETAGQLIGECKAFHEHVGGTIKEEIGKWEATYKKALEGKPDQQKGKK